MARASGTGIIVQARMCSKRLPRKVLRLMAGRPLLQYVLERVARCRRAERVVVCTSTEPEDDAIADLCGGLGTACFRGDHENVARRYLATVEHFGLSAFVRVCGDSPLIDPGLIDHGLEILAGGGFDIVTNNLHRTFPSGQTVEALSTRAYRRGYMRMREPGHLEHVTRYFYDNPGAWEIFNFTATEDYSGIELSVDTEEDFRRVEGLIERMDRPHWDYTLGDIVAELCPVSR